MRAAGQAQIDVPDRVREAVLAHHPVQPVLRDGPALGEQGVDGVHDMRPAQQPALVQLPYHRRRFTVAAAHRVGQQPAYGARVRESGHRVGEGARHRCDRQSVDQLGRGQRRGAEDADAARRAQPAQPGDQDVEGVEGQQRRRGRETVQGERREAGDHRPRRRPDGRAPGTAPRSRAGPGSPSLSAPSPRTAVPRAAAPRWWAGPGAAGTRPAGSAARVHRAGTARSPRRSRRHSPAAARWSAPGAVRADRWRRGRVLGESGVLWVMTPAFPCPIRPLTAVTHPSTIPDKLALKCKRSTAERRWSIRGLRPRVTGFGNGGARGPPKPGSHADPHHRSYRAGRPPGSGARATPYAPRLPPSPAPRRAQGPASGPRDQPRLCPGPRVRDQPRRPDRRPASGSRRSGTGPAPLPGPASGTRVRVPGIRGQLRRTGPASGVRGPASRTRDPRPAPAPADPGPARHPGPCPRTRHRGQPGVRGPRSASGTSLRRGTRVRARRRAPGVRASSGTRPVPGPAPGVRHPASGFARHPGPALAADAGIRRPAPDTRHPGSAPAPASGARVGYPGPASVPGPRVLPPEPGGRPLPGAPSRTHPRSGRATRGGVPDRSPGGVASHRPDARVARLCPERPGQVVPRLQDQAAQRRCRVRVGRQPRVRRRQGRPVESWRDGNRPRTTSMPIWIDRSAHDPLDHREVLLRVRREQLPLRGLHEARDGRLDEGVGQRVRLDDLAPTPVP